MRLLLKTLLLIQLVLLENNFAQTYIGDYTSHSVSDNSITINADTSSLKFIFYKPDIVRIDFLPSPSASIDSSFIVIQDTNQSINYTLNEYSDRIEISTQAILIICQKYPVRLTIKDADGALLLSEPQSGGIAVNGNERTVNFNLDDYDHFYGTGERGTELDKKGQSFYSYNTQNYGYSTPLQTMNINVPFLADKKGYGIYFDNTYPGFFDLGNSNAAQFSYTVSGGEMSYYIFVANTIPEQLEKYTWLTGRQPLPPRWALGYIQSKFGYRNQTQAASMIQTMRDKHIPCDAVVLDLYWFKYMGDISWDFTSWPDPFQMMQEFLNEGIKTIVITEPYITEYSSNFSQAYANNYFAFSQPGNPVLIPNWWSCGCNAGLLDLTNPAARKWWWDKHPAFWGDQLSGIWTDLGEPENHPETMNHYLGSRDKVHNVYNFFWSQLMFNGINQIRPDKRVFNLTRSGFAGSQRYGIIPWSGDVAKAFGGLKVQLPMLLNMGMSGFAYHNSDIGGFCCGFTTPELYVRWMQYGTFCPVTRAHGVDAQPTEPWGFGSEAEGIAKNYISLRYRLLPYIYTMAFENYSTGMPLARPLFFEYPDLEFLNNYSDEYFWGDNFLVSPVTDEGVTVKNVYFPDGKWVDFFTDQVYQGPQNLIIETPIDKLPLFVKSGSIIPMLRVMDYTGEFPADTIYLQIYPAQGSEAHFTLYEDDGISLDYQSGSYALTDFVQNITSGNKLNIFIYPSIGNYSSKLPERTYLSATHLMGNAPDLVYKNGIMLTGRDSYGELRNNAEGYYYDTDSRILYVQIKADTDSLYQVRAEGIVLNVKGQTASYLKNYVLEQNYPNPFNPVTIIRYQLIMNSFVTLKVFNTLGEEITTLVNEGKSAGKYEVEFNAANLPSGVYFYQLSVTPEGGQAGDPSAGSGQAFVKTKKMILLK